MTSFTSEMDLKGLINLLNMENQRDSEDDDYEYGSSKNNYEYKVMNDACCKAEENTELDKVKPTKNYNFCKVVERSKNIWDDDDEILCEEDDEAMMKEKPEYELVYEQSVTPNDVLLQFSGKGPGTDSCECLLVKIKLPGILSKDEVNLNIETLKLVCKTRKYYLNLDLPKEVNPTKCSAKWDQEQTTLTVKLLFENEGKLVF